MNRTFIRAALGALACLLGLSATAQTNPLDVNVALPANGGVASASSVYSQWYAVGSVNNNERKGAGLGLGNPKSGVWIDETANAYPDWVQIDFNGVKAIDKVVVYSMQDNFQNPVEPTDTLTFTQYGVTDFTVLAWNGTGWQVLATVTGNNLVKRTSTFAAFNTTKIRIKVTGALNGRSRVAEIEAWGVDASWSYPSTKNVALASTGATVTASSQYGPAFPVAAINDGDTLGDWASGGGWADMTPDLFPDWVEVDFPSPQAIDHITLTTLRDDWNSWFPQSDMATFTQYGVTDFQVQAWDGFQWVTVATVTGNNLVKRNVPLSAPYTTSKIRVLVTGALASYSRIVELQAWVVTNPAQPSVNVALASHGGVASASSQLSSQYPVSSVNDGDASGLSWSNGGGWADSTLGQFPDWVEVDFAGTKTIDHVVVYGLQDYWQGGVGYPMGMPAGSTIDNNTPSTNWGLSDYDVQGWDGTRWVTLGAVRGNTVTRNTVSFPAFSTSKIRVNVLKTMDGRSRIVELEAWTTQAPGVYVTNWARDTALATASTSSTWGGYSAAKLIDGDRAGSTWGTGGGWADGTPGTFPDWAEVDFNAPRLINQVVLYTVQDNWQAPVEPTDTMTFSLYGIVDFDVQAWDGAQWNTVASVTGNNMVKRTVTFPTVATTKIRAVVNNALGGFSRLTELEAWGFEQENHASSALDAVASASSVYGAGFPAAAVIDGERKGTGWGSGGGWADGTMNVYPDWVQIDFPAPRSLHWLDLYTLQDNWQSPVEPTDAMTFTQNGVQDFTVQAWTGLQWQTVATVTGNTLVKRGVPVSVTASSIRVMVNRSLNYLSRITEIEAWGDPVPPVATVTVRPPTDFALPAFMGTSTLLLASGIVGAAVLDPVIPAPYGSEQIQIALIAASPADGTWEMMVSPTKGLIDSTAGPCYASGFATGGSLGSLEWTPVGTSSPFPICFVDTTKTNYVNIRFNYTSCAWGTCGYALAVNPGVLPAP